MAVSQTVTYTISGATNLISSLTGIQNAIGNTFNKGNSTVTYIATDTSGNIASCSF